MGNSSRRVPSVLFEIPNLPSQNRRSVNNIRFKSSNTQPKPDTKNLPVPRIDNIKNSVTSNKQSVNNTIPTTKNLPVPKTDTPKPVDQVKTTNRVSRRNRKTVLSKKDILTGAGIGIGCAGVALGLSKENEDN